MAIRSEISIDWSLSPRLLTIDNTVTEITVQDIYDTCRNFEDTPEGMNHPKLIAGAGKESLGGGKYIWVTAAFQNVAIMFDARPAPLVSGSTVTSNDSTGTLLTDSSATFTGDSLYPGCTVFNATTAEMGVLLEVRSDTVLYHRPLAGGSSGEWTIGDNYSVYPNVQCEIQDGNLLAYDASDTITEAVRQSANVQVVRTLASGGVILDDDLTSLKGLLIALDD